MNFRLSLSIALLAILSWQPVAIAQVNEQFADLAPEIEQLRDVARTERRTIIEHTMVMSATEAAAFWPVYDDYRTAMTKAQDQLVKVVTDYAAARETLADARAKDILDDYLDFETAILKIRKKYVARFGKALPMTKVARFYQIDNKLDIIARLVISAQIPLMK